MMQHHIAHLLAELFTSEFHRRTYHPIANHVRRFFTEQLDFKPFHELWPPPSRT